MEIKIKAVVDAEAAAAEFIKTAKKENQPELWEYYEKTLPPLVRGSLTAVAWQAEEAEGSVLAFGWLHRWNGTPVLLNTIVVFIDDEISEELLAQIEQEVLQQAESLLPTYK